MTINKATSLSGPNRFVTGSVLRRVARNMLPFYKRIAFDRVYAARWSRAVITADIPAMQRLFRLAAPRTRRPLFSTDKRGYLVNFEFRGPVQLYGSGTANSSAPLGTFVFSRRVHQAIAQAVLPLYAVLAANPLFARALAQAIRRGDIRVVRLIVRSIVTTPALRSVKIESSGLVLTFKYPFSSYTYEHVLLHEVFE